MKIVLAAVNAKYIHSNLAVYSLAAYAGKKGFHTDIEEFTINQRKDEVLKRLFLLQPDILCFSCYIWNISYVEELIGDVKKILPNTRIWAGGPEVSYDACRFLEQHEEVSVVMCQEGEATFAELLEAYRESRLEEKLPGIAGTAWRLGLETYQNPLRPIMDMDDLIFPYGEIRLFKHKIIYYESSRGCPFSCSYCLSSIDKKLRFKSLPLVKRELQFFLDARVPQVKFVDRTFNCKKDHACAIWSYIKEHDNGVTNFHFEIAADLLTDEETALIQTMRPGLIQLEIGVQSTNPKTLTEIRRKTNFLEIEKRVRQVQEGKNTHQHLDLIAGLPYEDYDSFRKSFHDVYALRPQQLQLGFLKVLKGSYMGEKASDYGCAFKAKEPYEVLKTEWLTYGDILKLKGVEEMTEIYYNSGQFTHTLPVLETLFSDSFTFYEALAEFYEGKGYNEISHSRIRRYDILLEFIEEKTKGNREYYRQLLIYDLYLRENLKSRPSWAAEQNRFKMEVQDFYKREKEKSIYLPGYKDYDAKQIQRMTHLEVFSYDVYQCREDKGCFPVLFDYFRRDPMTGNAKAMEVLLSADEGERTRYDKENKRDSGQTG